MRINDRYTKQRKEGRLPQRHCFPGGRGASGSRKEDRKTKDTVKKQNKGRCDTSEAKEGGKQEEREEGMGVNPLNREQKGTEAKGSAVGRKGQ